MVPEIPSAMDRIHCHFLDNFLPWYPPPRLPNNPKNQNFEKNEKNALRYHHCTKMYQKSRSHATLFLR